LFAIVFSIFEAIKSLYMNNTATKIIYWVTTGLLSLFMISGVFFLNSKQAADGIAHMQIPKWLALEVGYGQPLAALLLILPFIGKRLKEWAYVAMGIVYLSAFTGHMYLNDPAAEWGMALVMFAVLLISYICYHKLQSSKR
jgi:hypothetical protein